MAINIFKVALLTTVAQLFLFGSCNKDNTKPCVNGGYSFKATAEWETQKEVYNTNDTIYLTSIVPKMQVNQINNSLIDYSDAVGVGGDLSVASLDSIFRQAVPARDSFSLAIKVGSFSERKFNTNAGINFLYQETSNNYLFQAGFICKKKGTYVIYVSNLLSAGLKGKNCTNAGFDMMVTNTDKHSILWQNALQMIPDQMQLKNMYCFRVL